MTSPLNGKYMPTYTLDHEEPPKNVFVLTYEDEAFDTEEGARNRGMFVSLTMGMLGGFTFNDVAVGTEQGICGVESKMGKEEDDTNALDVLLIAGPIFDMGKEP